MEIDLVMCATCRSVKDGDRWLASTPELAAAIKGRSVSHGVCPNCFAVAKADLARRRAEREALTNP